jgi:WD40 repeat protein
VVDALAFSPDGRTLAAGSWDGTVQLLDLADAAHPMMASKLLPTGPDEPPENVRSVAFAPDGRTLAVASDQTVRLWDLTAASQPKLLGNPLMHDNEVTAAAYSPDGRSLATASTDNTVRMWDVADRLAPVSLGPGLLHDAEVEDLAFSPDGRLLATSAFDGTARLWDVADRTRPQQLGGPLSTAGPSSTLAFDPDGQHLATGGSTTLRLWELTDLRALLAHPVASACGLVKRGLTRLEWNQYIAGLPYRETCPA